LSLPCKVSNSDVVVILSFNANEPFIFTTAIDICNWWRKEYGGLDTTRARKLKDLEKENTRLKHLVADLSLDNAILKDVLSEK
jgi:hypothetical protein